MDPNELQVAVGRTIRELRAKQGYSQEAFAVHVGLHRTYMGGVERSERNIGVHNLARIADALDMQICDLFGLVENPDEDGDR